MPVLDDSHQFVAMQQKVLACLAVIPIIRFMLHCNINSVTQPVTAQITSFNLNYWRNHYADR